MQIDPDYAGQTAGAFAHSTPVFLGWHTVSQLGTFTVVLPPSLSAGEHRLVVVDEYGELIGWSWFTVTRAADGSLTAIPSTGQQLPLPWIGAALLLLVAGGGALLLTRRRAATEEG